MGVLWRGKEGIIGPEPSRVANLVLMILVAIATEQPTLLLLQEIVGVACFTMQFQRPLFCILQSTFHWMSHRVRGALPCEVVDELLTLACLIAAGNCDLRAREEPWPVATDASSGAGGACEGVELNCRWQEFWQRELLQGKMCTAKPLHAWSRLQPRKLSDLFWWYRFLMALVEYDKPYSC